MLAGEWKMFDVDFSDEFIVKIESSSDGSQDKYYKEGYWYKVDKYGGEGAAEELVSILLKNTTLSSNEYVNYELGFVNKKVGCRSKNFLESHEQFISFAHIHKLIEGCSFGSQILGLPLSSKIKYCVDFFQQNFNLDISDYLSKVFYLDMIIRNEDRNFGNLGLIYDNNKDTYRVAPIFDNGYSLIVGNEPFKHNGELCNRLLSVSGKPFSGNLETQAKYFDIPFQIDYSSLYNDLKNVNDSLQKEALLFQLDKYQEILCQKDCEIEYE